MSISKDFFGHLKRDDKVIDIFAYTMKNANGMQVKILSYGGVIAELKVPDRNGFFSEVVGGYDCLDSYVRADGYQGALIGRCGNRINKGKFILEGKEYSLFINDKSNHLHGGEYGFDAKVWDVVVNDGNEPELVLHILSPDGDEGSPGNLDVTVTYRLTSQNGLIIHYVATTNKTTVINLTNHAYFNLGGYSSGSIYDHTLMLDADTYIPTDEELIPTGEIKNVEGTPFDFRVAKKIGNDINANDRNLIMAGGYDHCCNLVGGATKAPVKRGELYDANSGRVMEIITNQPCIQFYSGNFLKNAEFPFQNGYKQTPHTLLCLETQHMPDSINHDNFTNCVLKPDGVYDFTTEYRFSVK